MYTVTLIFAIFLWTVEATRILVCVPCPSLSHQVVFYPLINRLLERHHEVVFITTDPMYSKDNRPANLTEIDTHNESYSLWKKEEYNMPAVTTQGDLEVRHKQVPIMINIVGHSFIRQMETPQVQDLIKKKPHFDLLIVEGVTKATQALSHVFKAPMILMNSMAGFQDNYHTIGAPMYPQMLYPNFWQQRLNNLTVFDKIKALLDEYRIQRVYDRYRDVENNDVKRLFGPDTLSLEEVGNNVDMLFLNIYPLWDSNRPVPPSVVYIGGIYQKPEKELPNDLKHYLDYSSRGVVYFSLGTNVKPSTFTEEKIKAITNGLARLDYDVLIKWDHETLPGKGNNTKVVTWIPQSDVLRHPKIKAFVTQGGLQSFDEALTGGVPLVGIPMFADQWYNVQKYEQFRIGIGITVDLTEDLLVDSINKVIKNPSYRRNMIELRARLRDQPERAVHRAVWWVEHVIRHRGAKHLRAPAANITWTVYLDLKLMAALGVILLGALGIVLTALYLIVRCTRNLLGYSKIGKLKEA